MDPTIVQNWPIAVLLFYFIWAIQKKWWIPGNTHTEIVDIYKRTIDELKADRDEWKKTALRGTDLAESAVRVAGGGSDVSP